VYLCKNLILVSCDQISESKAVEEDVINIDKVAFDDVGELVA